MSRIQFFAPLLAATSMDDLSSREHNFESVFRVPSSHRLVTVRSRARGRTTTTVFWEHDEYNSFGHLVARYKSFEEVNVAGERRCGWQKFDKDGRLVGASQTLRSS